MLWQLRTFIMGMLLLLLSACASTPQQPPQIQRISPEELERILPKPVPNLSLDEIVRLSQAGTSAELIIEKIKATDSHYDLTPSQSVDLSNKGVSAKVLDYIHSSREQALRDGFANEINKRESARKTEQQRLKREYESRSQPYYYYDPFYDPFWGYGYRPYWGFPYYGPSFNFYYHHRH